LKIYGFSSGAIKNIDSRKIGNVDWLFEWKKHWKPTEIDKFIVAPTWETIENSSKIVIYIEPNMAFGTGTHETTRLCLQAIGENYQGEMSFLDVGTGTGILSIAAMKFKIQDSRFKIQDSIAENANRFWACDTDATSIEIAKENAELNDVAEINFYVGSISVETPSFDFVCANLTADVILPILPILIEKSNTFLILSGILKEQENSITQELNRLGVYNVKIETLGEWISVMIKSGE
jgi:ribosomal protein L11 methyltransferase